MNPSVVALMLEMPEDTAHELSDLLCRRGPHDTESFARIGAIVHASITAFRTSAQPRGATN